MISSSNKHRGLQSTMQSIQEVLQEQGASFSPPIVVKGMEDCAVVSSSSTRLLLRRYDGVQQQQRPLLPTSQQQQQQSLTSSTSTRYGEASSSRNGRRSRHRDHRRIKRSRLLCLNSLDSSSVSAKMFLLCTTIALLVSCREQRRAGMAGREGILPLLVVDAATTTRSDIVIRRHFSDVLPTATRSIIRPTQQSTSTSSLFTLVDDIRGGASSDAANTAADKKEKRENDHDDSDNDNKQVNSRTDNDKPQQQEQKEQQQQHNNKFWPVGDLFRLYDEVKDEALSLEQQLRQQEEASASASNGSSNVKDEKEDENSKDETPSRGGAVAVKEAPTKVAPPRRGFAWFGGTSSPPSSPSTVSAEAAAIESAAVEKKEATRGGEEEAPFDTSSTAPLSSRLISEDDNEQQQQKSNEQQRTRWSNVGMQHVPDGVEDTEIDFLDESDDNEEDEDMDEEDEEDEDEDLVDLDFSDSIIREKQQDKERGTKNALTPDENEILMEAISHLKNETSDDSNQQQTSSSNDIIEKATREGDSATTTKEDGVEEEGKYYEGAFLSELPLANASMTEEEEVAALLHPESASGATPDGDDGDAASGESVSPYVSSGIWPLIDGVLTAGYSFSHPAWKPSRGLRPIRKAAAQATGLHGVLSGKRRLQQLEEAAAASQQQTENHYKHLDMVRRRLERIDRARHNVQRVEAASKRRKRAPLFGGWFQNAQQDLDIHYAFVFENTDIEETQRRRRVQEIDKLMADGQRRLQELATEKDVLQRRPNPLWNYTTTLEELDEARRTAAAVNHHNYSATTHSEAVIPTRNFNFPPQDLVDEYLVLIFSSRRLVKMNHTDLWRNDATNSLDNDDEDGDEWWLFETGVVSPSSSRNPRRRKRGGPKRQQQQQRQQQQRSNGDHYYYGPANRNSNLRDINNNNNINYNKNNGDSGSRWLRNGIGEKIGEAVEAAAYKAVCQHTMSFLARLLSSLHGINVMTHSDIRLYTEQVPDLPPLSSVMIPGSDENARYAQDAFSYAMRRGAGRRSKKRRRRSSASSSSNFMQRDAVVETLLSQCQIAAPLLKVFPLNWQRAMLGNIITLVTCVVSDFVEGLEFQILGHSLSFAFAPITEEDMIRHLKHGNNNIFYHRMNSGSGNANLHQNPNHSPERFEEAVRLTARDLCLELNFLDKWHERALGGDMLKTQIATLIARLVLSLVDEILCGARMDLWTTHAGGPRLVAGLEYRRNSTSATIPGGSSASSGAGATSTTPTQTNT